MRRPLARLILALAAVAALLILVFGIPNRHVAPAPTPAPAMTPQDEQDAWDGQMAQFLGRVGPKVKAKQVEHEVEWCRSALAAEGIVKSRLEILSGTNAMLGPPTIRFTRPPHYAFRLYEGSFAAQVYAAKRTRAMAK